MIDAIRVGDTVISSEDMSKAVQHLKKFVSFFDQDKQQEIFKTIMEEFFQRQFVKQLGPTIHKNEGTANLTRFETEFTVIDVLNEKPDTIIYSAINHIDRCAYAIKKIHFSMEDVKPEVIMQEAVLMQELVHPNIVRYLTSWIEFVFKKGKQTETKLIEGSPPDSEIEFHFFIQEELCSKDNILDVAKDYNISQRIDLLLDTASGIKYLHENQVIHNSLKPSDILISLDGIPKICNFSKSLNLKLENLTGILPKATIYTAPEAIVSPSIKTDIFSFAIISIEILSCNNEIAAAASKGDFVQIDGVPKDLMDILLKAASTNPNDRPSISDIMAVMSKASDELLENE